MSILIVDYGLGNIASIRNIVRKAGGDAHVSSDPKSLETAKKIILPGVGAFDRGADALSKTGIGEAICRAANQGSSVLGICLGMQLLMDGSEEGMLPGLGLVPGRVHHFPADMNLKVPHMGWNYVSPTKPSTLFGQEDENPRFYFVHSYFAKCTEIQDVAANTHYGINFASAFSRNNVYGVQFHPEKSHRFGLELFQRFISL
jgi:glutamine amidotransferase